MKRPSKTALHETLTLSHLEARMKQNKCLWERVPRRIPVRSAAQRARRAIADSYKRREAARLAKADREAAESTELLSAKTEHIPPHSLDKFLNQLFS